MIHLLPHWSHPGFEGMPVTVWAYTNCDEAELFLNGVSLGRKKVEKYLHAEWQVPYTPGKLEAVGYLDGRRAAGDVRETAGPGVALALKLENGPVAAGGNELALFTKGAKCRMHLRWCGSTAPEPERFSGPVRTTPTRFQFPRWTGGCTPAESPSPSARGKPMQPVRRRRRSSRGRSRSAARIFRSNSLLRRRADGKLTEN